MTSPVIHNPVVRGLSPDPSACRVRDDFFLATSTLEFWPGIPIRHSRDLENWEVIGHAITRPAQYRRDGLPGPLKLYAPTLRHHAGRFYLACTNVAPGQGNFIVSAEDPAGEWSDAQWIDSDAFDPSLTFDGETTYYTRRTVIPGKEGSGPVVQAEIDIETGMLLTDTRAVTPGEAGYRSNDIEGPHLFRRGDWWYLASAEGGTWKGHMQTIARSRSPWGPFEGYDGNPILTHRNRVGHPIQSTGHAELLDDARGNWWALFLGTRHNGPVPWHHLGRETFLAPVVWEDDWPIVGTDGTVEFELPLGQPLPAGGPVWPHERSAWTDGWSTRETPLDGVRIEEDTVRLPPSERSLDEHGEVAAAFLRQEDFVATFEATIAETQIDASAGVTVYASPAHHYDLVVSGSAGEGKNAPRRVELRRRVGDMLVTTEHSVVGAGLIRLRVTATPDEYRFAVATIGTAPDDAADGTRISSAKAIEWRDVGSGLVRLLSAETSQTYSGIRFGVFAHGGATTFSDITAS